MNCITYTLLRNQKGNYSLYVDSITNLEFFFFVFYLLEMLLKILGFGLIFSPKAYFRVAWNLPDFLVIVGLILSYTEIFPSFDFTILRSLRLLGPLRTIASFSGLGIILSALFSALPLLFDALLILLFSYSIYAIISLQLFSGVLKYRCIITQTGLLNSDDLCGNLGCPLETICAKGLTSLDMDVINFDNVFSCFLQVMFVVTLASWSDIMYSVQQAFSNYAWIYFLSLVIFESYMINNLLLAVIKVKFSESQTNLLTGSKIVKKKLEEEKKFYDFTQIKREGYWVRKRNTIKNTQNAEENRKSEFPLFNFCLVNLNDEGTPLSKFSSLIKSSSKLQSKKSKNSISMAFNQKRHSSFRSPRIMTRMKHITKGSVFSLISPSHKLSSDGNFSSFAGSISNSDENQQKSGKFQDKMMKALKELANLKLKKKLLNFFNYGKMKKKRRQSKLFANLRPEYLKLYVDNGKEYQSLSEKDVIVKDKLQTQMTEMERQIKEIKFQKIPFKYTLKKHTGLFNVLQKVYSTQLNQNSVDSSNQESNELMKYLHRQSFQKSLIKSKQILKPLTAHFSRKKTTPKNNENVTTNMNFTIKIKTSKKKEKKKKNSKFFFENT